ncbi:hypothetical protein NL676_018002 [Syzygium grande]|nr:hypothetical protein NL676_018002 [Syzygium grande]
MGEKLKPRGRPPFGASSPPSFLHFGGKRNRSRAPLNSHLDPSCIGHSPAHHHKPQLENRDRFPDAAIFSLFSPSPSLLLLLHRSRVFFRRRRISLLTRCKYAQGEDQPCQIPRRMGTDRTYTS